jgi:long-chain acyl-CoA synthetase
VAEDQTPDVAGSDADGEAPPRVAAKKVLPPAASATDPHEAREGEATVTDSGEVAPPATSEGVTDPVAGTSTASARKAAAKKATAKRAAAKKATAAPAEGAGAATASARQPTGKKATAKRTSAKGSRTDQGAAGTPAAETAAAEAAPAEPVPSDGGSSDTGSSDRPTAASASAKKAAGKRTTAQRTSAGAASGRKAVGKKATARKASADTASAGAASGRKAVGKKGTARKASADAASAGAASGRKAVGKKATARKASADAASAGTAAGKKATAKKATAAKATAKTAKRATAKKATAKKAAATTASARRSVGQGAPAKEATPRPAATSRATTSPAATPGPDRAVGAMPDPASVPRPWLDAYPPGVPASYAYPLVPLTRLLDDAAKDFPETEAIHFLGYRLTYRQLLDKVDRFAAALSELGVRKGDRVGLILPNCPQHVVALFAALRIGAVVAENNPLYTEAELEHQINDAGCKVLVCLDPIYAKLARLKGRLRTVEHIIATGIQDALPFPKNLLFPVKGKRDGTYAKIPEGEGVLRMTDLVNRTAPTATQVPVEPASDLAMLLYTGGTTGVSKGVMLTHYNLVANAFQGRLWLPDVQAGRENVLCVLPFFHSYGLTTCLTVGMLSAATLTLLPRFDVDTVLKTIDDRKPTLFPGVPTIYVALNNAPDVKKYDLSSIRACLSGAAPLPVEVARTFEELTGGKLREGYGLTETSPITHANPIYGRAKKGKIGLPVTDTVCVLMDLDDPTKPAEEGQPGELAIHGPQVMAGYWNRPEETAEVLRDGWLLTGDIATIDEEGYVAIVDRKKDMIIAGGYNVYPRDVEEVLFRHPKVAKAVVAGIPDAYRGETVKAYIVLKEGQRATAEEVDAFCRSELAAYKVPTAYEFRDELPETMVGKVLRRLLVEEELAKARTEA